MTSSTTRLRPRDRDAIISALRTGVVPRGGFQHIQVGRAAEIAAMTADVARVADGGAAVRFVIGEYGAGKTFFLNLVRSIAAEHKLVTAAADLTPDRRLHAGGGQARSLYAELMRNLATRSSPDGNALASVVERFVTSAVKDATAEGVAPRVVIARRLDTLSEGVGGYDFAQVIGAYWRAHDTGDETLKHAAIRWLRGEYTTKSDARAALGVRTIVDDASVYDQLKLMARFVRLAGYGGLLLCLDEMVNLYKLAHTGARKSNYEQVLRIVNDCLQGNVEGLGVCFGGTPEMLMDTRRGLYSYEALRSRLAENTFAVGGLVDHSGPVLRLANLTAEDMYVLLERLRTVFASGDPAAHLVPDEALSEFMQHCSQRIGDAYFRTPRNTIKEFVNLLAILEQNPGTDWRQLIGAVRVETETNTDLEPLPNDDTAVGQPHATDDGDELAAFRL
ncbi:ATP-binding protein [Actinokineospora enzanensis]|uniref:ATP-binding protein n=1 Tax=Actinokineospora enzanensis TaxID=155975 RepID=UPI000366B80E|nr:ATP-binding protein [Actinokineospora enzanensis]